MKKLICLIGLICSGGISFGQLSPSVVQHPHEEERCGQHHMMQKMQLEDPVRYQSMVQESVESLKSHYSASTEKATGVVYTIPVVFHILHMNGTENISAEQCQDAINILNRDYRRLNFDADQVNAPFQGMQADAEIQFVLATKAPNGACFNGITRTVNALSNDGSSGQAQVQAIVDGNDVYNGIWPHNQYLNIFVCKSIGGAAGYAYYPNGNSTASVSNMYYGGIFVLSNYVGSIGTSNVNKSRTLTHECGHWMNLAHVWGSNNNPGDPASCNTDDGVQDTPNCIGVSNCTLNSNTCNSDDAFWGMAMPDNIENYMDYSYCTKMFTQGQVTRMRTALTSSVGGRSNIWTNANLQLVGAVTGGTLCSIDFTSTQPSLCTGNTVTYSPNTTTGISAYSWTFPGGTPSSSTAQNPVVTYATAGTYNATLTVTGSADGLNYTEAKTNYVSVNAVSAASLPLTEGFASTTFPPNGWSLVSGPGPGTAWARSSTVGNAPTAGNSILFDNYNYSDPNNDEIRMPVVNAGGYSTLQLAFDVAYAPYNNTNRYDGLEVLVSTDCGATFTRVYYKVNTDLATASPTTSQFTPTAAQWRNDVINLNTYAGSGSVWIAFRNIADNGNRLFIDNINLTGTVTSAPTVSAQPSGSAVCAASNASFTAAFSNNPTSYQWQLSTNSGGNWTNVTNGGVYSNATTTTLNITGATVGMNGYQYRCVGTNAAGSTNSNAATLTVNAQTTPAFTQIAAFCAGTTAPTLPGTSTNSVSGTWTPSTVSNSASGTYAFNPNAGQCATTTTMNITVNPTPSATVTPASTTTFCQGGSVVLNANTGSGLTYQWKQNGTTIGGATSSSYTANAAGTYTVVVTNGSGCTATSTSTTVTVNPTPSATVIPASTTTFCQGGSVVLNANTGSGLTYQWKQNGTTISGATSSSYTANAAGTYTVVVTNGSGCTATSTSTTVTVNPTPSATVTPASTTTFCQGGSVVLNANTGSGLTYQWKQNGTTISGATSSSYTANAAGTYTVVVTNGSGCTATSTSTTVTVNPIPATPTISATGPLTFCSGGSVTLTSSASSGNNWSTGSTNVSINVTGSGTYTVNTTENGCTSSNGTVNVVVNPTPSISMDGQTDASICGAVDGTLTIGGSGTGNITWSGTSSGTLTNVVLPQTVTSLGAGSYNVQFTSDQGCVSNTVNGVVADPSAPDAPTITASGSLEFCEGESVTLTSSASTGNNWSTGETTQSIIVTTSGTYSVLEISGTCSSNSSEEITVTVNQPVAPMFDAIPAFCEGTTAPALPGSSTNGINGIWSPATVSNTASGTYTFIPAAGQCATNATIDVVVNPSPAVTFGSIPELCVYDGPITLTQGAPAGGTYSGNGVSGGQFNPATAGLGTSAITYNYTNGNGCSGSAQSSVLVDECLGISESDVATFSLYPNPSNGIVTIDGGSTMIQDVHVFNHLGQLVKEIKGINFTKQEVNLSNLADGVYTIRVTTEHGIQSIPVVIEK